MFRKTTTLIAIALLALFLYAPSYAADTTPPAVTIVSPASGEVVSGTIDVVAYASDAESGVTRVVFYVDGEPVYSDFIAPYITTVNTEMVPNGQHTVFAVAFDNAGNSATSAIVHVFVQNETPDDTTPPVVAITSPADGETVSGTIDLIANAYDAESGVDRVVFFVDGSAIYSDLTAPYVATVMTTYVADGYHTVFAQAFDNAGNYATSATVTVTVDNDTEPEHPGKKKGR